MTWQIFYWPMGKSTFSIIPAEKTNQPTFVQQSMRIPSWPCEEPNLACLVDLAFDLPTFRLNSRDHVRDRSTTDKAEIAYGLSSFRFSQRSDVERSRTKPTTVSINVHHTETSDFPQVKRDHDIESTTAVDITKLV
jgi:hypothetical protein